MMETRFRKPVKKLQLPGDYCSPPPPLAQIPLLKSSLQRVPKLTSDFLISPLSVVGPIEFTINLLIFILEIIQYRCCGYHLFLSIKTSYILSLRHMKQLPSKD